MLFRNRKWVLSLTYLVMCLFESSMSINVSFTFNITFFILRFKFFGGVSKTSVQTRNIALKSICYEIFRIRTPEIKDILKHVPNILQETDIREAELSKEGVSHEEVKKMKEGKAQ